MNKVKRVGAPEKSFDAFLDAPTACLLLKKGKLIVQNFLYVVNYLCMHFWIDILLCSKPEP